MNLRLKTVNKEINHLPVILVKGYGVFYFEARDGGDWFGESISIASINQVGMEYWMRKAVEAASTYADEN